MLIYMDPQNNQPSAPPQPNQSFPPPQSPQQAHDPYGFIMDTQHQPKKKLVPNDGSFKSRILMLVGFAAVLIIAIVLISTLLSGSKESNTQLLTALAAEQTEIIRVADLGIKGSTNPDTLAYVQTTKSSLTAEQVRLLGYLASKNVKVTPIILSSKLNKATDKALISATASNEYDTVLITTIKESLNSYSKHLAESYKIASNPESKLLLADSFKSTANLLK